LQIHIASVLTKCQAKGLDFIWWHTPNGGSRNKAEAGKLKMMGLLAGVPDLIILYKGKPHFIELKIKGNVLSDTQEALIPQIERQGLDCHVIYADSIASGIKQVAEILIDIFDDQNRDIIFSASSEVISSILPAFKSGE
jgi:hypothetical protein